MRVKAIGRQFGFYLLLALSIAMAIDEQAIPAAIYLTGAILFDAIKTIGKR